MILTTERIAAKLFVVNYKWMAPELRQSYAAPELRPRVTRNGLKGKTGGGWIERQPDGLEWHCLDTGMLEKLVSPAGDVWTITRSNCLVSEIAGPGGRTTMISGGTVTQPGGRVTSFGQDDAKNLTSVTYPGGDSISLTYGDKHLLSSITIGGKTTSFAYDRADRIRLYATGLNP